MRPLPTSTTLTSSSPKPLRLAGVLHRKNSSTHISILSNVIDSPPRRRCVPSAVVKRNALHCFLLLRTSGTKRTKWPRSASTSTTPARRLQGLRLALWRCKATNQHPSTTIQTATTRPQRNSAALSMTWTRSDTLYRRTTKIRTTTEATTAAPCRRTVKIGVSSSYPKT